MDAEIASLRSANDNGGELSREEIRALLDALKQARKAYKAECEEHKRTIDEACEEEDNLTAQREQARKERDDSYGVVQSQLEYIERLEKLLAAAATQLDQAQQSAKDARALLEEAKVYIDNSAPWHPIRARIEAMLEQKP